MYIYTEKKLEDSVLMVWKLKKTNSQGVMMVTS